MRLKPRLTVSHSPSGIELLICSQRPFRLNAGRAFLFLCPAVGREPLTEHLTCLCDHYKSTPIDLMRCSADFICLRLAAGTQQDIAFYACVAAERVDLR